MSYFPVIPVLCQTGVLHMLGRQVDAHNDDFRPVAEFILVQWGNSRGKTKKD